MRERSRTIRIDDEFDLTAQVIRTAEPVFLREVPAELLEEAVRRDPNAAEALEHISIQSAITVPLRSGERTYGALTLVAESRELEDSEFELAQEPAARAAIAVENARLYREAERRAEAALALAYGEATGASVTWARIFQAYGAGESANKFIRTITTRLLRGERTPTTDGGNPASAGTLTTGAVGLAAVAGELGRLEDPVGDRNGGLDSSLSITLHTHSIPVLRLHSSE